MERWRGSSLLALALAGCVGSVHAQASVTFDAFEDDPVTALGALETRLTHARAVDVAGDAGAMHGAMHVEPQRASSVTLTAPRAVSWTSLAPRDRRALDTDAHQWGASLLLELVRAGAAPTWRAVLAGTDPDILHADVESMLVVSAVAWKDRDPSTRTLTFTVTRSDDGVRADVALTLDARGLPVRRVEGAQVETYARFDVQ